jgi:calcineurin-like phosphoesterase family protein
VGTMDEELIKRWNARVAPSDLVYHLGDFAFTDHNPYLKRLKGQKHLILGNHDHSNRIKKTIGWASISNLATIRIGDTFIVLCHYGMRVWNRSHYGALHFYGHSHGSLPGDSQCTDVGVDCWDFSPVRLPEIRERLMVQPPRAEPNHHEDREEDD